MPPFPGAAAISNVRKADDAYCAAHAALFLRPMDGIVPRVPRDCPDPHAAFAFGNVLRFVNHVLFDSVVLLEHWAALII
jgi:hypothetical protein